MTIYMGNYPYHLTTYTASPDGWAVWGVVVSTRWWLLVDRRSLCPEKLGSNPGQGSKGINFSRWHDYQMQGVYETRHAHMSHVPRTKSRFVDKLPLFQFPTIWNNWYSQMNVNSSHSTMRLRHVPCPLCPSCFIFQYAMTGGVCVGCMT